MSERMQSHHQPPHLIQLVGPMTLGARRAIVALFILSLLIGALNLLWTSREVHAVSRANMSSCQFFADVGGAPVAVNPQTGKASLLGVTIIADSRQAWRGRRCPGKLPPPQPSFRKWAAYYRLPAS